MTVDFRYWTADEGDRVREALGAFSPADPRVGAEVTAVVSRPPMEPTPESLELYRTARAAAAALGFGLAAARVGGASDGNLTAAAGIPTLDGLGPRGGGAHARGEHVELDDLPAARRSLPRSSRRSRREDGPRTVRELRNPAEYLEASQVAKAAWDFPDLMVSPPPDMITATHAGGMTAGAFESGRLVGFVHAVPRTNLGQAAIHSHLLAVHPGAQRRGLSILLKLFQREWCLARGIGLVTWTYDPFMLRNARLNLVRLGAVVPVFIPNFYGAIGGIYGELPSDRFEAHWRLKSRAVERAARGETSEVPPGEAARTARRRRQGRRVVRRRPPVRLLPFPAGFPEVFRADLEAGIAARRRFGRTVTKLFANGWEAVSVVERDGGPAYVLERRPA